MRQQFELTDRDGNPTPHRSVDKQTLIDTAASLWPGQPQDDGNEPDPNGWDIKLVW